jgi:hypothetical protein
VVLGPLERASGVMTYYMAGCTALHVVQDRGVDWEDLRSRGRCVSCGRGYEDKCACACVGVFVERYLGWGVRDMDLAAGAVGPLVRPFFIVVDEVQLVVGGALLY